MVHLAFLNNNLDVLDSLVHDYGLDASITDKLVSLLQSHFTYQYFLFITRYELNAIMRASVVSMNGYRFIRPQDIILRCYTYGLDVNYQCPESGMTALHYAVQSHSLQSVRLLLWLGANITFADKYGRTPYDFAILFGNRQFAQLLATPDCQPKLKRFNIKQNLLLYYRFLLNSSSARCSELRFWIGAIIVTCQVASKCGNGLNL